jgi:hypothetical protein
MPPQEPTLLIIVVMAVALVGWIALMALAAWISGQGGIVATIRGLFRSTHTRRRRVPIRGDLGRLMGSKIVRDDRSDVRNGTSEGERRSENRSASESQGTTVPGVQRSPTNVLENVLTVPEMLQITAALTRGVAPSEIAKALPGYSGEKYKAYMEKVKKTQAVLAESSALEIKKEIPAEVKTA